MSAKEIASEKDQYTLWQIFGIWLAAGAPMWLLGWVAYPALSAGHEMFFENPEASIEVVRAYLNAPAR
jgi:hypothetical protein